MKKKIAIVMAAAMALTMAGCSVSTTSKAPAGTTAQTAESASETAAGSSEAADSAGAAKGDAAETTERQIIRINRSI